jgi:hypothetical protein
MEKYILIHNPTLRISYGLVVSVKFAKKWTTVVCIYPYLYLPHVLKHVLDASLHKFYINCYWMDVNS